MFRSSPGRRIKGRKFSSQKEEKEASAAIFLECVGRCDNSVRFESAISLSTALLILSSTFSTWCKMHTHKQTICSCMCQCSAQLECVGRWDNSVRFESVISLSTALLILSSTFSTYTNTQTNCSKMCECECATQFFFLKVRRAPSSPTRTW